jgi:hypothetical protein
MRQSSRREAGPRITSCHPERGEGSWCLPEETPQTVRAETKIPRCARDDTLYFGETLSRKSLALELTLENDLSNSLLGGVRKR